MTQAGITYRTGKPWTADWLQSDVYRARLPLKGYRRKDQARQAPGQETGAAPSPPVPAQDTWPDHPAPVEEPEFQPTIFIDWDAKRSAVSFGPFLAALTFRNNAVFLEELISSLFESRAYVIENTGA
jgi:hypothetical protein